MGVSRTPIREALGRLASEGFLERLPHRGFRVPEESLGNLLELYPIVASLELLAGRLALEQFTPRRPRRAEGGEPTAGGGAGPGRRARDAGAATTGSTG